MTTNNNQPETETPTFKHEQEVWVKATIIEQSMHRDFSWFLSVAGGDFAHVPEDGIRTTEQICAEVIKEEEERLKNIGIAPPCDGQNAGREAPHDAELPDRTRMFRKGDKVQRRKELYGRPLNKWADEIPFDVIYEVLEDEDPLYNHNVRIEHNGETYFINFIYFDLVEPAPEQKYKLEKVTAGWEVRDGATVINFMRDLCYTLEEAQAECDRLNRKEEENA